MPPVAGAHVTSDGLLSLPVFLGADRCAAAALTDADLSGLLALFDHAEQDTVAIHRPLWMSRGQRTWTTPVR